MPILSVKKKIMNSSTVRDVLHLKYPLVFTVSLFLHLWYGDIND